MDVHYVEMLNVSLENNFQLAAVRHPGANITVSVDNVDHRRLHAAGGRAVAAAAGRGWRGVAGHGQRLGLDPAEHIEPHERGHRHERHPQPGGHEQKVDRLKLYVINIIFILFTIHAALIIHHPPLSGSRSSSPWRMSWDPSPATPQTVSCPGAPPWPPCRRRTRRRRPE